MSDLAREVLGVDTAMMRPDELIAVLKNNPYKSGQQEPPIVTVARSHLAALSRIQLLQRQIDEAYAWGRGYGAGLMEYYGGRSKAQS